MLLSPIKLEQKCFKVVWWHKRPWITKAILRKKNGAAGIKFLDFRLFYKTTVIKRVWYLHKIRNIDQWNRLESPEINPCTNSQLIFDKVCKNIQQRKDSLFNNGSWKLDITCKRMNLEHSLILHAKINSKWIKGLNVRLDTIKL